MTSAPFIDVKNLRRVFDVSKPWLNRVLEGGHLEFLKAVDGVTFDIAKGETFALVGESGSGKTTVARMVVGLLPPTSGEVVIDGVSMSDTRQLQARQQLRRRIQMIFQDPYASLNPRFRVDAIVAEPIRAFDLIQGERNIQARVGELLNLVGLHADDGWKYPHEFSGGQRQRIAIARALASEAEFIVCDEPTSALDVSVQAQILNLMRDLQDKFGLTYLFISHNLAVVRHMANRIGVMYLGRIVEIAEGRELFSNPRMPYTKMLLGAVPDLAMSGRQRIPVKGEIPNPIDPPPGCAFNPRCPLVFDLCRRQAPALIDGVACHAVNNPAHAAYPHDHDDESKAPQWTRWQAASAVVKCARRAHPRKTMDSHEQHQSRSVHHPAGNRRHLRGRHLHPLDRHRGRHGHPGEGRQRLRRRRRHRVHAAGGRAASERPRRRRADHRARHQARPHRGDLRPGPGAGGRHHRALPQRRASRWCPAPGCWRPAFPAPSTPGCCCCATTARCGCATCWSRPSPMPERLSAGRARLGHHRHRRAMFRKHWPTSAAVYLPDNEVPKPGTLFTNKTLSETYARILKEAESAGGDRVAQIERARKAWSHGFVAEAIDQFCRTQEIMDVSGSPHRGVLRADDMARWQATVEAPLTYDYGRYTVCKAGPWSQGPVMLQQLALLKGFDLDGLDPDQRRLHPSGGRGEQARLCRPRRLLRRSQVRRRADGRRCCRTPTTPTAAS